MELFNLEIIKQAEVMASIGLVTACLVSLIGKRVPEHERGVVLPMLSTFIYAGLALAFSTLPEDFIPYLIVLLGGPTTSGSVSMINYFRKGSQSKEVVTQVESLHT